MMKNLGLDYESLKKENPQLIMTSITPFGQDGPYSKFKGADIVCWAMGGMMYHCGEPDRPPNQCSFAQAYLHSGAEAAAATMIALYHRGLSGEGQHIDVSVQACVSWTTCNALEYWPLTGCNQRRVGVFRERGRTGRERIVYRCQDGYVCFMKVGGQVGATFVPKMVQWLDEEGLVTENMRSIHWEKGVDMVALPQDILDEFGKAQKCLFAKYTVGKIYQEALKRGIMLYPLSTAKDIAENEQLEARNYWEKLDFPELGEKISHCGAAVKLSEVPLKIKR